MIAIIDYGMGNLFSLSSSLKSLGYEVEITADPERLRAADKLFLPGVGAFRDAQERLFSTGLADLIRELAAEGKPLMGICLGMQLLFDKSYEYGEYEGLGLIPGTVVPMEGSIAPELKIPQIGWNALHPLNGGDLFFGIPGGTYVYFVHSYYLEAGDPADVAARTQYGVSIDAAVEHGKLFACQFHPEKSSDTGLRILENFVRL